MLRRRTEHPAFHPDASQQVFKGNSGLFVHKRISCDGEELVFCIFNLTAKEKKLKDPFPDERFQQSGRFYDILRAREYSASRGTYSIKPYQALWLIPRN